MLCLAGPLLVSRVQTEHSDISALSKQVRTLHGCTVVGVGMEETTAGQLGLSLATAALILVLSHRLVICAYSVPSSIR